MNNYVKPVSECHDIDITLPVMMSLNDEVGNGQLSNSSDFEEEGVEDGQSNTQKDNLQIGF